MQKLNIEEEDFNVKKQWLENKKRDFLTSELIDLCVKE